MFYKLTIDNNKIVTIVEVVEISSENTETEVYLDFEEYKTKIGFPKGIYRFLDEELIDDVEYVDVNIRDVKTNRIIELKEKLNTTDYQIIKCYEAFMRQQPLPYNLEELSAQRDSWRTEINQLEQELEEA
jgi:hypothetical protein